MAKNLKLTITAGHSDDRPGAYADGTWAGKPKLLSEEQLMQDLATICVGKAVQRGHTVRTDVVAGINKPLAWALGLIFGSDAAIELHANASADPRITGVEIYSLPKHKAKAQGIAWRVAQALGVGLRGDKGWKDQSQSQHTTLAFVQAGGMLLEVFWISNPTEVAAFEAKQCLVAQAIVEGLEA
jgi:N-acetylmuramoyl-L-alanine amidase